MVKGYMELYVIGSLFVVENYSKFFSCLSKIRVTLNRFNSYCSHIFYVSTEPKYGAIIS